MDSRPLYRNPTVAETPRCPRCQSADVAIELHPDGPHHALGRCRQCAHAWWLKAPWTVERALRFVMPFGIHRGRTIGELLRCEDGRDYLGWVSRNLRGNPGIAARIALDSLAETCFDVSDVSLHRNAPPAARHEPTGHADDALTLTPEGIV